MIRTTGELRSELEAVASSVAKKDWGAASERLDRNATNTLPKNVQIDFETAQHVARKLKTLESAKQSIAEGKRCRDIETLHSDLPAESKRALGAASDLEKLSERMKNSKWEYGSLESVERELIAFGDPNGVNTLRLHFAEQAYSAGDEISALAILPPGVSTASLSPKLREAVRSKAVSGGNTASRSGSSLPPPIIVPSTPVEPIVSRVPTVEKGVREATAAARANANKSIQKEYELDLGVFQDLFNRLTTQDNLEDRAESEKRKKDLPELGRPLGPTDRILAESMRMRGKSDDEIVRELQRLDQVVK